MIATLNKSVVQAAACSILLFWPYREPPTSGWDIRNEPPIPQSRMGTDDSGMRGPLQNEERGIPAAQGRSSGGAMRPGDPASRDSVVGLLRYVPPTGSSGFLQGSPEDEPCRYKDESQFAHVLTKPLAVMETEVTQQMWQELKKLQPTLPSDPTDPSYGLGGQYPVQSVTWQEAVLFANLLSIQNGLRPCYTFAKDATLLLDASAFLKGTCTCEFEEEGYRLPTEGEWEYFARAGTKTPFPLREPHYKGKSCYDCSEKDLAALESIAWFCLNSGGLTHPVGQKAPNPWNLMDVHGNVRELCWDWQAEYPRGKNDNYTGPATGTYRIIRGGGVAAFPRGCRSANRYGGGEEARGWGIGFRLVRTLPFESSQAPAGVRELQRTGGPRLGIAP